MTTKKELLNWWNGRGKITDEKEINDDKQNLLSKWQGSWQEQQIDKNTIEVILNTPRWKYPVKLFFTNEGENYRIVDF